MNLRDPAAVLLLVFSPLVSAEDERPVIFEDILALKTIGVRGQPMEFYRVLKDRVELVFYPREGHGLREYYHRLDRMQRQYDWIVEHTLGTGSTSNSPPRPKGAAAAD